MSLFLVAWLLGRIGPARITDLVRGADPVWLAAGAALFLLSHVLGSLQWRLLLEAEDLRLPFRRVLEGYFVGLFFNNFLIGGAGGDVYRVLDVRRRTRQGPSAVSGVLLDRMMGFLAMCGLSVLAIPFAAGRTGLGAAVWTPLLVTLGAWGFLCAFFFSKRFARPFTWTLKPFVPAKLQVKMRQVYRKIHAFGRRRSLFLRVAGLSLVVQSARIATHYLVGLSLGLSTPAFVYFLFVPIIAFVAMLPLSVGGIGLREQTGVVLFGLAGMGAAQAVAVEFISYLVAIATSLPGGLAFVASGGLRGSRSRKETQS